MVKVWCCTSLEQSGKSLVQSCTSLEQSGKSCKSLEQSGKSCKSLEQSGKSLEQSGTLELSSVMPSVSFDSVSWQ